MGYLTLPEVVHDVVDVDGIEVFHRAAGPADAPTVLLLHGFPSASHQYRRLIDALGHDYRLVAPDYPGFGHTRVPEGRAYSFEMLTDVVEGFVRQLRLTSFVTYMFDFGGPVGLNLAVRHPEWVRALVVQNANAYDEGLSDLARATVANRPGVPGAEEAVRGLLTLEVTRGQYEQGVRDGRLVAPDGWTLDQHFLDSPGRDRAQVELALDYHTNVASYPRWQRYLREHRPPTLVLWGRNDPFFVEAGAHAYRRDVPDAEVHVLDTGHFALEDHLNDVTPLLASFLDRTRETS